jgi:predicted glycoside hydrolase/deacetylase ChbG (UPF0249 family)
VGLHFDLGEWAYRDGGWVRLYKVVEEDDAEAVVAEAARQFATFRRLVGRSPTHLDSHQHVHRAEPVRSVLVGLAHDLSVPLRHFSPEVRHCGAFYGQTAEGLPFPEGIRVEALIQTLASLPPGVTELGCHPAEGDVVDSMYSGERAVEVKALCDPRVWTALAAGGVELCSFHRFGKCP